MNFRRPIQASSLTECGAKPKAKPRIQEMARLRRMSDEELVKEIKTGNYPKNRDDLRVCFSSIHNLLWERGLIHAVYSSRKHERGNNSAFFFRKKKD